MPMPIWSSQAYLDQVNNVEQKSKEERETGGNSSEGYGGKDSILKDGL